MTKHVNTGLLIDEKDFIFDKDWIAGGISGITYEVVNEIGNWIKDLPTEERQKLREDTFGCTGFSLANVVETQIDRYIRLNLIELDPIREWLDSDGRFNGSDSILNTMAGNTPGGNSMRNPLEALRTRGLAPQSARPITGNETWAEFHRPITPAEDRAAKKFFDFFNVAWEILPAKNLPLEGIAQVSRDEMKKHIKQAPLWVAVPWCPGFSTQDPVSFCKLKVSHAIEVFNIDNTIDIFDTYEKYIKELTYNYYIPIVYKVVITPKDLILKNKSMAKTNAKIVAVKDSAERGVYMPTPTADVFKAVCKNHGIEVPLLSNGSVDWESVNVDGIVDFTEKTTVGELPTWWDILIKFLKK